MPSASASASACAFPAAEIVASFRKALSDTPPRVKVLDIFIAAALATLGLQVVYAVLVGSFPFNAFLSGVFCCAGTAVLTLCLRLQISSGQHAAPDRAFVDYALAMVVLLLACWCYIG